MSWFKKKPDPISDRSRALNEEIAELEAEIKRLDSRLQRDPAQPQPRLRSTAVPHGATVTHGSTPPSPASAAAAHEPIFEEMAQDRLKPGADSPTTAGHYNELGVRKYDLPALLRRIGNLFHGPTTTNPKLVSYLAAGGVQGLRPLRYEKRVARNRTIALVIILFTILFGVLAMFYKR
jgi:hypothetical protein